MFEPTNKVGRTIDPINKSIDDATYKQIWKVAFIIAESERNQYPLIDIETLARRVRASLYSYYGDLGRPLTKIEASDFIECKQECPIEVLNRVIYPENLH